MSTVNTIQKRGNLNEVHRIGTAGPGGAYHDYAIINKETQEILAVVEMQKGPRQDPEARHGAIDSDLLEIVRDRLKTFQANSYACEENQHALEHVELALLYLNKRVEDRIERQVLGTMQK